MYTFIKIKMGIELNWNLIVAVSIFLNALGHCEMSIYPGLRRKPLVQTVQQSLDVSPDFLSQLMEENARRKLQQQIEQQVELISYQLRRQHERKLYERLKQRQQQKLNELLDNDSNDYIETAAKTEHFKPTNENLGYIHERPEFAYGPFDPRYYASNEETENSEDKDFSPKELEEYQEYIPLEKGETIEIKNDNAISNENKVVLAPAPGETTKLKDGTISANFHRIKPQLSMSNANGAIVPEEGQTANDRYHHKDNNHDNIVMREHIGFKSDLGVYIVALIAGVSAAFTVGLIALGVVWVHNKTKATGDVDYPAYGVTGPIRDLSPSGDRKLAQSAQMYHYQHQKQQIIAMENQQIGEGCCALSDVDSDDDNEEGDYTVYECPGLAPTGEMEVKNPLFLDETPVTPLKNVANTQVTLQQPQTNKKESRLLSNAATNDKRPKKNKK